MNPLLFAVEHSADEFVITPQPDAYLVTLRLDEEQAKAFPGQERITLALVLEDNKEFGLLYIRGIDSNNYPTEYMLDGDADNCGFTPEMEAVLTDPVWCKRIEKAVTDFVQAVRPDLPEYYAMINTVRSTFTA